MLRDLFAIFRQPSPPDRTIVPPWIGRHWQRPGKHIALLSIGLVFFFLFSFLIHIVSQDSVLGADYYTFWMAGKALFIEHTNPYSQAVTEQIQMGILGRLAAPHEDQMAFAYPPYSLLVIFPAVFLSFDWATSAWLALNIMVLAAVLFLLSASVRGFLLTSFLFFPFFAGLVLGSFNILVSAMILLFFGLIARQKRVSPPIQVALGILAAWSTMKPQFVWLVLGFILLYALREKLFLFLKAFWVTLAFLLVLSFWMVPGWLVEWPARVQAYAQYVQSRPTIVEFLLFFVPLETAFLLAAAFFVLCAGFAVFLLVRWWNGQLHWLKVLAWMGVMTYLFHLHGTAYEQLIFILPLILWVGLKEKWKSAEVLLFWGGSLVFSWVAFLLGIENIAIDRSPVLANLIWTGWLLAKPGGKNGPAEAAN